MRQTPVVPNQITSNSQRRTKIAAVSDQDFYLIANNNYYRANIKRCLKASDLSTPKIIVLAKKGHWFSNYSESVVRIINLGHRTEIAQLCK